MVPNSTAMSVVAIFKSRLLKMTLQEKFEYLCNQVEAASNIKHAVTTKVMTSYGIKISTFFEKKKIGGWVLKLSSVPLTLETVQVI